VDISQLRTFVAVAHHGSTARASEQLAVGEATVSAQIRAIEETLGLALFDRSSRVLTLTSDGERLLAKAEATLAAHQALMDEARRLKGHLTGRLRLGAGGSSIMEAISRLVTHLAERYPEVEVALDNVTSLEVLTGIRNGTLDAGFYNEAGDVDAALTTIEVARFGICVVAPRGLVDTSRGLQWPALAQHTWVYPTTSTCCGTTAENLFKLHQFRPNKIVNIEREPMTRTLVAGGAGIGIVHADTAAEASQRGELEILYEAHDAVRALFAHLTSRTRDPLINAASAIVRTPRP
jgi:DNA-binding transcriptional LysR family regulator